MTRLLLGASVVIALALSACKQEPSTSHPATPVPAPAPVAQQPLQTPTAAPLKGRIQLAPPRAGMVGRAAPTTATQGNPQ